MSSSNPLHRLVEVAVIDGASVAVGLACLNGVGLLETGMLVGTADTFSSSVRPQAATNSIPVSASSINGKKAVDFMDTPLKGKK